MGTRGTDALSIDRINFHVIRRNGRLAKRTLPIFHSRPIPVILIFPINAYITTTILKYIVENRCSK